MLLEIDDSKTIGDLQEKFFLCFPNLKIELFMRNKNRHIYLVNYTIGYAFF